MIKAKHVIHGLALLPTPLRIVAGAALAGSWIVRRRRRKRRAMNAPWAEAARQEDGR